MTPKKTTTTALAKTPEALALESGQVSYRAFNSDVMVTLTLDLIQKTLTKPTKSGKEPTRNDCLRFMMLCRARELNPFEGDAFLVGYDTQNGPEFSLITAHQALLKRAEANPDFGGLESGVLAQRKDGSIHENVGDFYLPEEKVVGGWANVHRKNLTIPFKSRLRIEARRKNTAIWGNDASGMITKCAEADALRMAFPTKLGGLYLKEEMELRALADLPQPQAEPLDNLPAAKAVENLAAPKAAGASKTVEAEVVPEADQEEREMHWSHLLKDDEYRLVKMPETSRFAGATVHEVTQDKAQFAEAHAETRRETEDAGEELARMALDAAIYRHIENRIIQSKLTIAQAEAKLIEAGAIVPEAHLTDLEGHELMPMLTTMKEVLQKKGQP